jgi:hypothetical protein
MQHEHLCRDRSEHFKNSNGVYNAFMIMKPGNKIIKEAIHRVFDNCYKKNYSHSSLYPTGPGLLGEIIPQSFKYLSYFTSDCLICDMSGNVILEYDNIAYRSYIKSIGGVPYNDMFGQRHIYNNIPIESYMKK